MLRSQPASDCDLTPHRSHVKCRDMYAVHHMTVPNER